MSLSVTKVTTNLIPNQPQTVDATLTNNFKGEVYCGIVNAAILHNETTPAKKVKLLSVFLTSKKQGLTKLHEK